MIIENHLRSRLLKYCFFLSLGLWSLITTQAIATLFHDLSWDAIDPHSLGILLLKESLPGIPLVLNLTVCMGWGLWKHELYRKKEVFSLWLSGWGKRDANRFLSDTIFITMCLNFLILMILMPLLFQHGPSKNQSWLEHLAHQNYEDEVFFQLSPQALLMGEKVVDGTIIQTKLVQANEKSWSIIHSKSARYENGSLFLKNSQFEDHSYAEGPMSVQSKEIQIPLQSPPKKIIKERLSISDLYWSLQGRLHAELIWRIGLVMQSLLVLTPFRRIAPNAQRSLYGKNEIYGILSLFSITLFLLFLVTKIISQHG